MKPILTLIIIIFLATSASASCRTYYDYCINISLPNDNITGLPGAPDEVLIWFDDFINETNLENEIILFDNYTNVYTEMHNSSETGYKGIYNSVLDSRNYLVALRGNNTDGIGTPAYTIICLNGSDEYYSAFSNLAGEAGRKRENPSKTDFTKYYRRNWTFKSQVDASVWDFTNQDTELTVWCPTLSDFTINLTDVVAAAGTLTYQTLEQPKNIISVDGGSNIVREDNDNFLKGDFYITNQTQGIEYTFALKDYTGGDFYQSTLSIYKTINDKLVPIHVERFDQSNTLTVLLLNRTQYTIKVENSDGSVRDLGNLYLTEDTDKNIIVTQPNVGSYAYSYQDTTIDITKSWDNSILGCNINGTVTLAAFFDVQNVTGSTREQIANSYTSGKQISFTTAIPDRNMTYMVKCGYNQTPYGLVYREEMISLRNETDKYLGFDLNLPNTVMGISMDFVYGIISLVIMLVFMALFSSISFGVGAVVTGIAAVFLKWVGWLDTPWSLVMLILFLGIFLQVRKDREAIS